jgi:steroid 5-alpha reductase family enzyme
MRQEAGQHILRFGPGAFESHDIIDRRPADNLSHMTPGVLALSAAAIAATMILTWAVSVAWRDVSIVDPVWGLGFVVTAWTAYLVGPAPDARALPLVAAVTVWGLRLFTYLAWRKRGEPEDFRYQAMRAKRSNFKISSLWVVFGLQGLLMWIVSLPIQLALATPTTDRFYPVVIAGALLFATGLFFETVGDLQLARFKADPANEGKVMDRGLWRYTRHPNYFGDFCVWWGLFLMAAEVMQAWPGIIGPVVMSFLLLRVSGVAMLDKAMKERKPKYAEYIERTNAFFPGRPRF